MKKPLLKTSVALATFTIFSVSLVSAADEKKPAGRPDQAEMIKQFDANGDGKLDQSEREAARQHMQSMRGESSGRGQGGRGQGGRGPNAMAEFDTDGDGRLSAEERKAAEPAMRKRAEGDERAMKQFDKDGNGALDDKEWAAARKAMADRQGQGRGGRGRGDGEGRRARGE